MTKKSEGANKNKTKIDSLKKGVQKSFSLMQAQDNKLAIKNRNLKQQIKELQNRNYQSVPKHVANKNNTANGGV